MKYFFSRLAAILLCISVAGFGCKGLSSAEEARIRPVTLNYWTVYNDVETLQALAAEYKRLHPYVTVTVRQVRYEEFDTLLLNALADDAAPDMVSLHTRWLSKYQSRLAAMPSSVTVANIQVKGKYSPETVVTEERNFMPTQIAIRSQYVATVAPDVMRGGDVYGLPLALDTLAMYYNKDLLDKSGIAVPPATWDEFLDAVEKTTKVNAEGKIIQSGVALGGADNIEHVFDIVSLLMLQKGVPMADGNQVVFASGVQNRDVTNHPALEALRFYTDFARDTKKVYTWNESMEPALDAFVRGKSAFYVGFAYDRARIRARAPQLSFDVIAVPQLSPDTPVNVANYWIESVMKKSPHQSEAWDFIRFLSLPNNVKRYTEATGQPSPLRSHLADALKNPETAPFASSALVATNWYRGKNVEAANEAFRNLVREYLRPYGDADDPARRDGALLLQTAAVVQQTL